jgi:hypothetical protein
VTNFESAQLGIQAVGVVAVTLTLFVYYRQMRTMDQQRRATEREMAARMRPWVGLFGVSFEPGTLAPAQSGERLGLLLRNCGALPAQNAHLKLMLRPVEHREDPDDASVTWEESGVKALVPGEDGNYSIELSRYMRFGKWREARRDVEIEGVMNYMLDERKFHTQFVATLRFSEELELAGNVKMRWRNREVL